MELKQSLQNTVLEVYTADWCPDCRLLDTWLEANFIAYTKVNIEIVEGAAEKLESETGKRAIPFILVNGKHWVRGYHKELPGRFSPEILTNDLLEAASLGARG
jgi:glutaredoxin